LHLGTLERTLKAFVNTKLILIKRLAKDEIQHEISWKVMKMKSTVWMMVE